MVTNSIKTDTSLMLFIKRSFDCMEIGFLLLAIKLDALKNDFFPFGAREAFEGVEHLSWHAITLTMQEWAAERKISVNKVSFHHT